MGTVTVAETVAEPPIIQSAVNVANMIRLKTIAFLTVLIIVLSIVLCKGNEKL